MYTLEQFENDISKALQEKNILKIQKVYLDRLLASYTSYIFTARLEPLSMWKRVTSPVDITVCYYCDGDYWGYGFNKEWDYCYATSDKVINKIQDSYLCSILL
jgi:hypothetical protein